MCGVNQEIQKSAKNKRVCLGSWNCNSGDTFSGKTKHVLGMSKIQGLIQVKATRLLKLSHAEKEILFLNGYTVTSYFRVSV